jgi:hypothetical protein
MKWDERALFHCQCACLKIISLSWCWIFMLCADYIAYALCMNAYAMYAANIVHRSVWLNTAPSTPAPYTGCHDLTDHTPTSVLSATVSGYFKAIFYLHSSMLKCVNNHFNNANDYRAHRPSQSCWPLTDRHFQVAIGSLDSLISK